MPYPVKSVDTQPIRIGIEIEFLLGSRDPEVDVVGEDPSAVSVAGYYVPGDVKEDKDLIDSLNKVPQDHIGTKYISSLVNRQGHGVVSLPYTGMKEKIQLAGSAYDAWPSRYPLIPLEEQPLSEETPVVPRFGYWTISQEPHIDTALETMILPKTTPQECPITEERIRWESCEISSPIITNRMEIQNEFPTFEGIFEAISENAIVTVNEYCGMHIHATPASLPQGKPLDLEFAKRVVALFYMLEIDHIHRVQDVERWNSRWARPISRHSRFAYHEYTGHVQGDVEDTGEYHSTLAHLSQRLHGPSREKFSDKQRCVQRALAAIFRIDSLEDLQTNLTPGRWIANEDDSKRWTNTGCAAIQISSHNTFEIRYPEASFDTRFMRYWVCLTKRVFDIAQAPKEQFDKVFQHWFWRFVVTKQAQDVNENDRHGVLGLDWDDHKEVILTKTKHDYQVLDHFPGTNVDGFVKVVSSRTTKLSPEERKMWRQERARLAREKREKEKLQGHGEFCDCYTCRPGSPNTATHIW